MKKICHIRYFNNDADPNETVRLLPEKFHQLVSYTMNGDKISMEHYLSLYSTTRDIVNKLQGHLAYHILERSMENYIEETSYNLQMIEDPMVVLQYYVKQWSTYKFRTSVLHEACNYFNLHFVKRRRENKESCAADCCNFNEIFATAVHLWKENLLFLKERQVIEAALSLIQKERNGQTSDTSLISGLVSCFVSMDSVEVPNETSGYSLSPNLKFYRESFEANFLRETERYYIDESRAFLQSNSMSQYLGRVERILEGEKKLVEHLHPSSLHPLQQVCRKVLIQDLGERFGQEFQLMLMHDEHELIGRMYSLLSLLPKDPADLVTSLEKHVVNQGTAAMETAGQAACTDPSVYCSTIWAVYIKYKALVMGALQNQTHFENALEKGMAGLVNNNAVTKATRSDSKSAELLAKHCDLLLRKDSKIRGEAEPEEELRHVVVLFKYLENKDAFEMFYCRLLAKRLVQQKSAGEEREESAIRQLRDAVGDSSFGYRERRMLNDIRAGRDFNKDFQRHLMEASGCLELDFSVEILSSGIWPFEHNVTCSLPPQLEQCIESVGAFYRSQHSQRKLSWLLSQSKGELATHCFKQKYSFQVSTLQMVVLLQYNTASVWTVAQLAQSTGIEMEFLISILEMFVKIQVLLSDGETLQSTSKLSLNMDFSSRKQRVNIPIKLEPRREQQVNHHHSEKDRSYAIQAGIVRIMKMRQTLDHQSLLAQVISSMSAHFKPSVAELKRSIDILIEKEYIERRPDHYNIYNYLP